MKLPVALVLLCALAPAPAPASARTAFQARCEDTIGQSVSVMSSKQNGYRIDHTYS